MKKIIFLALGCSLLLAPSCKDFLQKDPTGSPTEAIFWQSKGDFELALTAVYRGFVGSIYTEQNGPGSENFLTTWYANWDNITDNAVGRISYDNSAAILIDDITPVSIKGLASIYGTCYTKMARINIFLDKLENFFTDKTDADYKRMKGEVLALRGILYHYLYACYGSVPVVKKAVAVEDMFENVSPKEEVYKAAIDDFDEAIALLGLNETYMQKPGHMTGAAAAAFRARAKLYHAYDETGKADPTEMAAILKELNTIPAGYEVEADPLVNFHTGTQSKSKEIMFSIRFLKPTMRNQIDLFVGNWKSIQPTRDLVFAFPNADGTPYTYDPSLLTKKELTETELKSIFTNRDMRLAKFIIYNDTYDFSDYIDDAVPFKDGVESFTYFAVNKLVTPISGKNGDNSWSNTVNWEGDQDVVLMRWGQVLLMKAEAAFESGDKSAAMGYINDLRSPRGIAPLTDIDQNVLRNEIRIETCFEGQRYFDMKRWRILGQMNGKVQDPFQEQKVIINPAHFDWPIPQGQIDIYEANGHTLTQNPNYK